jgi:hypothetical protein
MEGLRGYLIITVEEATGKTQRDQFTWCGARKLQHEALPTGSPREHSHISLFSLLLLLLCRDTNAGAFEAFVKGAQRGRPAGS